MRDSPLLPLRSRGTADDNRSNAAAVLFTIGKPHKPTAVWHLVIPRHDKLQPSGHRQCVDRWTLYTRLP